MYLIDFTNFATIVDAQNFHKCEYAFFIEAKGIQENFANSQKSHLKVWFASYCKLLQYKTSMNRTGSEMDPAKQ